MAEPFRLAVATFGRVFDVHPAVDALTLVELSEALSRFQLKTELLRKEERELDRARKAAEMMTRGEAPTGPMAKRIERHVARHSRDAAGIAAARSQGSQCDQSSQASPNASPSNKLRKPEQSMYRSKLNFSPPSVSKKLTNSFSSK